MVHLMAYNTVQGNKTMPDQTTTIQAIKDTFTQFVDERDWRQFHTPKNLSMAIATEAAELMELFTWIENRASIEELEKNRTAVEYEAADIAFVLLALCAWYKIDLADAIERKMRINTMKYPVEGRSTNTSHIRGNTMSDQTTTIQAIKDMFTQFVDERDWGQFHTPKNLSMAIAAEAAELMEIFTWIENRASIEELEKNRTDVEYEAADIALLLLALCSRYKIDLADAIERKMRINAMKYPVEKAKGRSTKYTHL